MANEIKIPEGLTYEDIRVQYGTGRYVRTSGSGRNAQGYYRTGFMTKIGDLDEETWIAYAESLVKENGDEKMLTQLEQWFAETLKWLRDEKAVHLYALKFLIAGHHSSSKWVDYGAFHQRFKDEKE